MKAKERKNPSLRWLCTLALAVSAAGCIKDDLSDCNYTFTVRAYDHAGTELGPDDVREAMLYVFDGDLRFVERVTAQVGQAVTVRVPKSGIHIVAWGNLNGGLQSVPQPGAGDRKDDCVVNLLPATRAVNHLSPDDLFRGEITVLPAEARGNRVVPVYREVGGMTVTVRNLREFTGFDDDDFSIVVRETPSAIDFHGNAAGGTATYKPAGSFVTASSGREYFAPAFNTLPAAAITIDIYHGAQLIASVSRDSAGNPVKVDKGRLTNVLIELRASIDVSVILTPWGQYQIWKEF